MAQMNSDEDRIFEEITRDLAEDPAFSRSPINGTMVTRRRITAVVGVAIGVLGILAALTFLDGVFQILGGIVGFLVMVVAGMRWPTQADAMDMPAGKATVSKQKSAYMAKLEAQWDERRQSEGRG